MPYYKVYIGGKPYNLYLSDKKYDLFLYDPLHKNVHGKINYTYDPNNEEFQVNIVELSDRAKYLLENGYLYVAITTQDSYVHYRGSAFFHSYGIVRFKRNKKSRIRFPVTRRVYTKYRKSGKWYCCKTGNDESGEGLLSNVKKVRKDSSQISFSIGDIFYPIGIRMFAANKRTYCNIRFYLYSTRGDGRFLKTICEPFRVDDVRT